jgi:hypothetical protein
MQVKQQSINQSRRQANHTPISHIANKRSFKASKQRANSCSLIRERDKPLAMKTKQVELVLLVILMTTCGCICIQSFLAQSLSQLYFNRFPQPIKNFVLGTEEMGLIKGSQVILVVVDQS